MSEVSTGAGGEYAPCPLCKQYSHSISCDNVAAAFNHFHTMVAHPARGHPMGHAFDEQTRDAAQVMMSLRTPDPAGELVERSQQDPGAFLTERNEILRTQLAASQADVARLREALNAMVSRWKSSKQNWTQAACGADRELSVTIQNTVLAALDGFPIEQAIKALGTL